MTENANGAVTGDRIRLIETVHSWKGTYPKGREGVVLNVAKGWAMVKLDIEPQMQIKFYNDEFEVIE